MKLFNKCVAFFVLSIFCYTAGAQRIDSTLNTYATEYQQEKIYIHFDKPAYMPGDTVWFKAYILAGVTPSDISKNFYIDFADADGKILAHATYPVIEASARGQFQVPLSLKSTVLQVKAYTQWMQNFDSSFLYSKSIVVVQKNIARVAAPKVAASIHFFPEGGDAIADIPCKIAFKANDQAGRPVNAKGVILNSKGTVVDSLKCLHDGMGYFMLTPAKGETYNAKWIDEQKNVHIDALPVAKPVGATLALTDNGDKKNFLVRCSDDAPANLQSLHIVATLQQQLVYMANVKLTDAKAIGGAIPTEGLPQGVLQVTLFDDNWLPQAERIIYVKNAEATFEPEVGFTALGLNKRGKNVVQISLPDTISSNLSIAITDADLGIDSSDNIISHLLLTGDLKGSVYKPAYYFDADNANAVKHLDLVMLTHGWRRYNWDKIVKGEMPGITYPKDSSYLYFSGKSFGLNSAQLRDAGDLFLILQMKDSSRQTLTETFKSDGTFIDPNVVLFDSVKVYYQFLKNRSYNDMGEIRFMNGITPVPKRMAPDKSFLSLFDTSGNARERYFAEQQAKLDELLKQTTLEGVTVTAKAKSPLQKLDETYTSGLFGGGDAYQFDIVNDKFANASLSVFTYLQGKVAGLQISDNGSNTSLSWRGGAPSLYLNEVPTDVDLLRSTQMTDVAYIKVFRPPFMGGFNGANGAIAVYTRRGSEAKITPGKGLPYKNVIGYSAIKEFYSPDYGRISEENEKQDIRTTLYWNPMILTTSENHKIKLTFYNNDVSNAFRVIVEGMSKEGRLTRVEKVIQ